MSKLSIDVRLKSWYEFKDLEVGEIFAISDPMEIASYFYMKASHGEEFVAVNLSGGCIWECREHERVFPVKASLVITAMEGEI